MQISPRFGAVVIRRVDQDKNLWRQRRDLAPLPGCSKPFFSKDNVIIASKREVGIGLDDEEIKKRLEEKGFKNLIVQCLDSIVAYGVQKPS